MKHSLFFSICVFSLLVLGIGVSANAATIEILSQSYSASAGPDLGCEAYAINNGLNPNVLCSSVSVTSSVSPASAIPWGGAFCLCLRWNQWNFRIRYQLRRYRI